MYYVKSTEPTHPTKGDYPMIYIMLCNMTQTTRDRMANVPNLIDYTTHNAGDNQNRVLSHYATLGRYDLIVFAEAESHVHAAQLSIALSNMTGMNIETLPTMNMSSLEDNKPIAETKPQPFFEESLALATPAPEYAYAENVPGSDRPY